ncbi:MAG TPA: family 43 glycosylhydrolase [Candidatus Faecousia excrementipullorum]|nr:family 43 glycosylhydrolase [Candidatus Faecousia excrementipullorum]
MKYTNPVIRGMYPDPSVCCVDGVYYLVNSTFEYMPGIPIFRSEDLVNWEQIGNALVDAQAAGLGDCPSSGGIFAPTIRCHRGRFFIITTYFGKGGMQNFFLTAERPEGPWSQPVLLPIEGIDPSLYWEEGKTYVQYACFGSIGQVVIDEADGRILEGPQVITKGCGGRDAEGPHIFRRDGYYYLLLAEGGTREGHMVTLMRSSSIWGPFQPSPYLPVVSNRDFAREPLQCVGHADWIQDSRGEDYLVALATRPVKHRSVLGRETVLTPAYWTEDGWLRGASPYLPCQCETPYTGVQLESQSFSMDMQADGLPMQIISPRKRHDELVRFEDGAMHVTGNAYTLSHEASPVLLALRQSEYNFTMETTLSFQPQDCRQEAGLAMYLDPNHHISLFITRRPVEGQETTVLVLRKQADDLVNETIVQLQEASRIHLRIQGSKLRYDFSYTSGSEENVPVGWTYNKHLSTGCGDSPNTGAVGGVFVVGEQTAHFFHFTYRPEKEAQ